MAGSPPRRKPQLQAKEAPPPLPDLFSSLPLKVLDNILSRLHVYDVVCTSALSRAWRRRWESLPTVDLTCSQGIVAHEVDALLLRRSAPIRTFRLAAFDDSWYVDALHDWILYLSRNGVENLFLWFPRRDIRLHSSLFSCRELTSLNLTSCLLPPAPREFVGFPSLKTLLLDEVTISEHGGRELAALICASPLIEVLELSRVYLIGDDPEDEWVIQAPNLQTLKIVRGFPYGGRIEHLPRLQSGFLNGCNYAKFLMGMAQVTILQFATVSSWSTEVDVLDRLPFLFENLRTLVISVDFNKMANILSFFCLLRCAPVLEELEVKGASNHNTTQEFKADADFLNVQLTYNMFAKLQVVKMNKILCFCNVTHLMEFILSKARVLQVLSVRFTPDALCVDEAIIAIKGYPRASPDAQVIILGNESAIISSVTTSSKNAEVEEAQAPSSRHDSIDSPTENAKVEESQAAGSGCVSVNTVTENAGVDRTHTTSSWLDSIDLPPENADVKEAQTTGSGPDSMDIYSENAEVEEAQTAGCGHGSVNTFTKNAGVDETYTTSCGHGSFDTSPNNADVGEAQANGSSHVSFNIFTKNAVVDETQTMGSGHDSMDTSPQNDGVEEAQTPPRGYGSVNSFTKNAGVDGTQTVSSGLVYDVHPLRRKRLDLESVAELEQLEEEKLELQRQIHLELEDKKKVLEQRMQVQDHFIRQRNIMGSSLKRQSEHVGITLPPFPKLSSSMSSLLAKSGVRDTPVNPGVGDATDDHSVSPGVGDATDDHA